MFVHTLSAHLISYPDLLTDDNLCQNLFNKLLIPSKNLKYVDLYLKLSASLFTFCWLVDLPFLFLGMEVRRKRQNPGSRR